MPAPASYIKLSRLAPLEISGTDACAFLHGQITGDLHELDRRGWMFSAWCLANGRVISTFILYRHDAALVLLVPAALKEKVRRRLSLFVMRAAVTIRDASDDLALLGIVGGSAGTGDYFASARRQGRLLTTEACALLEYPETTPRSLLVCRPSRAGPMLDAIRGNCPRQEESAWDILDLEAGYAWLTEQTSGEFLPQMLHLEALRGLSYDKGCYPGQEIIARLHYRGQLKRRLMLGLGHGEHLPDPGTGLVQPGSDAVSGMVIQAAHEGAGAIRILAVLEEVAPGSGTPRVQDVHANTYALQELPGAGAPP